MADFGTYKGLAVSFGADKRIEDLYRREEMDKRARDAAEARAKMYADDVKFQNAMNSFDNKIVKEYAQKAIQELGDWQQQNPDWRYNPQKRMVYNQKIDNIKNNEHSIRGMSSDKNITALNEYLQEALKDPQNHDMDAIQDAINQRDTYLKYGNQKGAEAAAQEGLQPFIFQKPKQFIDLNKGYVEMGNHFKSNPYSTTIQYLNNGRDGAYQIVPKEEYVTSLANQYYMDNKRQYDVQYTKKGLNPINEIKKGILANIETKMDIGEKNTLGEQMALLRYKQGLENAATSPNGNSYLHAVVQPGYVNAGSGDVWAETFGTDIPYSYIDPKGNVVKTQGDQFHYDGELRDANYKAKGSYNKNGVKHASGYVLKPITWAREQNIVVDPWGFGDKEIAPEWKDKAEIIDSPPDKDGNSIKLVKLKATGIIDANNPFFEGRFNKTAMTTKQREATNVPGFGGQTQTFNIGGKDYPVGAEFKNNKTGKIGYLQPDGTIK